MGNVRCALLKQGTGIYQRLRAATTGFKLWGSMSLTSMATILPHADFGDPECCGCIFAVLRGHNVDIVCSECAAVVRTVSAADLPGTFNEMELSLGLASAKCRYCGSVNLFPGYSRMRAFACRVCGSISAVPIADVVIHVG